MMRKGSLHCHNSCFIHHQLEQINSSRLRFVSTADTFVTACQLFLMSVFTCKLRRVGVVC